MRALTLFGIASFVQVLLSGQQAQTGAKALFIDTQTGRVVMPTVRSAVGKSETKPVELPAITGLMYYLEMVSPNGELTRVNTNRTFHSGDKFRLHVTSNIDGRLTILQSQDGRAFEKLFPSSSYAGLVPNVKRGVDTILPSPGGWFVFDEHPGEIRLLMMLTAEAIPTATQVATAQNRAVEEMRSIEKQQRGSKALFIETNDAPTAAYEVRVVNATQDRSILPGQIVVELKLAHRPRV